MALNDDFMLPSKIRNMDNMADLLQAEQKELDGMRLLISEMSAQFYINTASVLLNRYEQQFGIASTSTVPLQERRANIIAKQNSQATTTISAIVALANVITGSGITITEIGSKNSFIVRFLCTGTPANFEAFKAALEDIKPAHLICAFEITNRTHRQLEKYSHAQLSAYTHEQLRSGGLPNA